MSTQSSNKFKPCKKCGCRACRHHSTFKQDEIRHGNRQFRKAGRQKLGILYASDFESHVTEWGDIFDTDPGSSVETFDMPDVPGVFEVFENNQIGIGYTD